MTTSNRVVPCLFGSVLGSAAIFAWYEPKQDIPTVSVGQPVASVTRPESEPMLFNVGTNTPEEYVGALNSALTIRERARRRTAIAEALSEWAWADPEAVFAWLEDAEPSLLSYATDALEVLTLSDPARVARLSSQLNRRYQYSVVLAQAVAELAERDRNAAISRLDTLPAGQEYRAWRQGIADGFVARDPIGALSWAQSLDPASPETIDDVMAAIRGQNLELAFELAVASIAGGNTTGMDSMSWMTRNDAVESVTMARIGERIATLPREQATLLIQRFGEAWSVSAPRDALDWALEHWSVGQMMIPNIAINMRGSAAQSADIAAQLPSGNREQWLRTNVSVSALNMLGSDPASLPEYLAQFEHEPFYDGLIDSLAFNVTSSPIWQSNPAAIDTALESMPEGGLRRTLQEAVEASRQ